jgi:hypothetical protein
MKSIFFLFIYLLVLNKKENTGLMEIQKEKRETDSPRSHTIEI